MSAGSRIKAGMAYIELALDQKTLDKGMARAQAKIRAFGEACTNIGTQMLGVSAVISAPFALAARSFASFDDAMRLTGAVTQSTQAQLADLTKTAQQLGRDTSYTAQQVAEAMVSLGRMGFNPEQIQQAIKPVMDLARSTGTDLAQAGDIAANSLRIFGLKAAEAGDVADVLTVTANSSAQTLVDLFEALKMGGPQAAAAGESMRDTCAALGVLANMGIKGSLAGTALRKSFSQFAKADVQASLEAVGVSAVDSTGNLRKMADVMRDIAVVMADMPTAAKLSFAEKIFDIRGSLAGLTLTADTKALDEMLAKLQHTEGVAKKTADNMDAGLGGSFRLFRSAVDGALHAIADGLNSTLKPMVDKITDIINSFTAWIKTHKDLVIAAAASAAGLLVLSQALIALGAAAKLSSAGVAAIRGAFHALSSAQKMVMSGGHVVMQLFRNLSLAAAEYRNAQIPVLVSLERLCAAFGAAGSAANHSRAAFLLMSNAEAAAAAKTALAAKWQALTGALGRLKIATTGATAATYLQAAAEKVSAMATATATTVRKAAIAIMHALTFSTVKSTAATAAATAGNWLLAIAAKAAAVASLTLSAAMTTIAAHPIAAALIALGAVLAGVCIWMARAGSYAAKLSDEAQKLREKNDQLRKTDQLRMTRLEQLAAKEKLNSSEMTEATLITNQLNSKYGALGITIDKTAGKISLLSDAQERLNDAMRKAAIADLDAEYMELSANSKELLAENESLMSYWKNNLWSQITGGQEKALEKLAANAKKLEAIMERKRAIQIRRKEIEGNVAGATTETDEETSLVERTTQESTRSNRVPPDASDLANAAKRAADIERQWHRERQTSLQNELDDIRELQQEYRKLIQTMLEAEKAKPAKMRDEQKITALTEKLNIADEEAARRIEEAKQKAAQKAAGIGEEFEKRENDIISRRDEAEWDRKLETTLQSDLALGKDMLASWIQNYIQEAYDAKTQFQQELTAAQQDNEIDDKEAERLRELQEAFLKAESMVDKYNNKMQQVTQATGQAAPGGATGRTISAWSARELDAMFGVSPEDNKAIPLAQRQNQLTENTNKKLDRLARIMQQSQLSYT